jgi:hypothetical protein
MTDQLKEIENLIGEYNKMSDKLNSLENDIIYHIYEITVLTSDIISCWFNIVDSIRELDLCNSEFNDEIPMIEVTLISVTSPSLNSTFSLSDLSFSDLLEFMTDSPIKIFKWLDYVIKDV